jgi:DNA-binding MarR family transcriptional regulator
VPIPSAQRAAIMAAMEAATKTLSAQNLALSQAIAERLGISASDLECLTLARAAGETGVTAGDLAAATALTSGAITGVIDRLERARLVRRGGDAKDRRKVIVRPTACTEQQVPPLFEPIHRAMTAMWESYSDSQLELILDFLTRCRDVLREEGIALRRGQRRAGKAKSVRKQAPPREAARL